MLVYIWFYGDFVVFYLWVCQHSYGKSPFLLGKTPYKWSIFRSYVKLPEGIWWNMDKFRVSMIVLGQIQIKFWGHVVNPHKSMRVLVYVCSHVATRLWFNASSVGLMPVLPTGLTSPREPHDPPHPGTHHITIPASISLQVYKPILKIYQVRTPTWMNPNSI